MDTLKYKVLLAVIKTGSYSAVSEKLGYTVSGISRMISSLEEETGFQLLIRSKTGVIPTAECREILPELTDLVYQAEICQQKINAVCGLETGTVRIGTAYSAFYKTIAEITAEFHRSHPGILMQIQNGHSTELANALNQGELDLCIISRRDSCKHWVPLFTNEILTAVPADDPLAQKSEIPIETFSTHAYIDTYPQTETDNRIALRKHQIRPNIQFTTVDSYATRAMVEAGLGIALNNQLNTIGWEQHGIVLRPVKPRLPVEIGIAVGQSSTKAVRLCLEQLEKKLSSNLQFFPFSSGL